MAMEGAPRVTLHKHHINGKNWDNDEDNLVWLCGSCHTIAYKAESKEQARRLFVLRHKKKASFSD